MPKSRLLPVLIVLVVLALAGLYFKMSQQPKENAETATAALAAQNLEVNEVNFFAEIKAGHAENVHYFILAGADASTLNADGLSALIAAANAENKDVFTEILASAGGNPKTLNLQDPTPAGKTALILAVEKGDADRVNALLNAGADTQATDKTLETPLIAAMKGKHDNLLQALIAADATQTHPEPTINMMDSVGETALTYAIRNQDKEAVEKLIAAKADAVTPDRGGVTPLFVAAEVGNEAIGSDLLKAGAKTDIADHSGNTPLTDAIKHARYGFAKLLLDSGADPDFHTSGPLPLEVATAAEPFDATFFSYLLSRSKQAANLTTASLFDAIDHKNNDLAKLLIERGINPNATTATGETALYHAIENGLPDVAVLLIDKGADIYQTGAQGLTPIGRAVKHNEIAVVQKLLAMGVAADQKTAEGYTLAETAIYGGYPEILEALLTKGARVEKDFGLLWAIRDGDGRAVPVLLKYGAHPNVMSNTGDPALWLAASAGETVAVQALIAAHAPVDSPNAAQSMTPLAIASHGGQLPVVKLLVEAGAKLEAADTFGMTPLAHASYMAKPDVVEYLISKGANVHAVDKQGRSAVDLAALGESSAARDKVLSLLQQKH